MNRKKIILHEVEEIGAWNNFKNICMVLEWQENQIRKIIHLFEVQQKELLILQKKIDEIQRFQTNDQINAYVNNVELPRWMKKNTMKI